MNGVKARLDYLEDTKTIIKNAINSIGGNIDDTIEFDEYPSIIDTLIEEDTIPQSTLDNFVNDLGAINGEVIEE